MITVIGHLVFKLIVRFYDFELECNAFTKHDVASRKQRYVASLLT